MGVPDFLGCQISCDKGLALMVGVTRILGNFIIVTRQYFCKKKIRQRVQHVYQYSSCTALLLAVQYICLPTVALHPCFLRTRQLADYDNHSVLHSDASRHLLPVLATNLSTRFERQQVDQILAKLSLGTMYILSFSPCF